MVGDRPVAVVPPVDVMRPQTARTVPAAGALPGGVQYSVKLDGLRIVGFALGGGRAVLQSRSGRDRSEDFPAVTEAVAAMPAGVVLDGELCAWRNGALVFNELLRSRAARESADVALSYVVFDQLAMPDEDIREWPLSERWELLTQTLRGVKPPLQLVKATNGRQEAMRWGPTLAPLGVEGLVCRGLDTRYRPSDPQARWMKFRHSETLDAQLVAVTGPADRPRGVQLELPDGQRVMCSPQLSPVQRKQVGDAVADNLGPPETHPEYGEFHQLDRPLPAEAETSTGTHRPVRFVRVRDDD